MRLKITIKNAIVLLPEKMANGIGQEFIKSLHINRIVETTTFPKSFKRVIITPMFTAGNNYIYINCRPRASLSYI